MNRIYLYCADTDRPGFMPCFAMAEDGTCLGSHMCSSESWVVDDLGAQWRVPDYQAHYPDGYILEFVRNADIENHEGLMEALRRNHEAG